MENSNILQYNMPIQYRTFYMRVINAKEKEQAMIDKETRGYSVSDSKIVRGPAISPPGIRH